jgi:UDP-N-acetylmuramate--alanine ligase
VYAAGGADRRRRRPLAGAPLRVAGHVDPLFVDDVADLAQAITEQAHDGDVVIAMGAGSIGTVAAQLAERLGTGAGA